MLSKVQTTTDQNFYGFGWTLKRTPKFFEEAAPVYSCEHADEKTTRKFCPDCGRAVKCEKRFKLKALGKGPYLLADPVGRENNRYVNASEPLYLYHTDDKFETTRFPKPGHDSSLVLKNAAQHQEEMEQILCDSGDLEGAVFGWINVGQHSDDGY
jgi:hypothetical protein